MRSQANHVIPAPERNQRQDSDPKCSAASVMRRLNPNCLCAIENGRFVVIEDVPVEEHWFRLEYQCDLDGRHATAWCRSNPLGVDAFGAHQNHLLAGNQICLGTGSFDLDTAVRRARYWTLGYVCLRRTGEFPNL